MNWLKTEFGREFLKKFCDIFWTDDNANAEYKGKIYLLSAEKAE